MRLKRLKCKIVIRAHPDFTKTFTVDIDVSDYGVEGILS